MNHIFRVVFNHTTGTWTAVAEIAKSRGKTKSSKSTTGLIGVVLPAAMAVSSVTALAAPPASNALPTGGQVAAGNVQWSTQGTTAAPVLKVDQGSQRAVVDWKSFDVGAAAAVQFNQPNAQAAILNRVQNANPTQVFCKISAN